MSTLYDNERAYFFLSDAEKAELEAANNEGRVMFLSVTGDFVGQPMGSACKNLVYRIAKPEPTKPSIDWDQVVPWLNYMAMNSSGVVYFHECKPELGETVWFSAGRGGNAQSHISFKHGTCDWRDSLVMRPEVKE
jgi:hypothetical protein